MLGRLASSYGGITTKARSAFGRTIIIVHSKNENFYRGQTTSVRPRFASSDTFVTSGTGDDSSPFLTNIVVNQTHTLQADEPREVGGKDLGPSPYDLLLSALGSCTAMTLRMYADRKNLNLTKVSVSLSHSKVHKKDCEECSSDTENEKGGGRKSPIFDRIERKIQLEGDLTDKDRMKLLEIADKCPVHRTLEQGQVVVVSSLVGN